MISARIVSTPAARRSGRFALVVRAQDPRVSQGRSFSEGSGEVTGADGKPAKKEKPVCFFNDYVDYRLCGAKSVPARSASGSWSPRNTLSHATQAAIYADENSDEGLFKRTQMSKEQRDKLRYAGRSLAHSSCDPLIRASLALQARVPVSGRVRGHSDGRQLLPVYHPHCGLPGCPQRGPGLHLNPLCSTSGLCGFCAF